MIRTRKTRRSLSIIVPDRDFLLSCYEKFIKLRRFGFAIADARQLSNLNDEDWFSQARQYYLEE
jgi:hypothetical protein